MRRKTLALMGALLFSSMLCADTLGFFEQKFSAINFERGKWTRTVQLPCYTYTATENAAAVEVLRVGTAKPRPLQGKARVKRQSMRFHSRIR